MLNATNEVKELNGIRVGDLVEYRMGARKVVALSEDRLSLDFYNEVKEVTLDEVSILNHRH